MPGDQSYQRHLPHQIPANTPLFLTWNLKGAITREMYQQIEQKRRRLALQAARAGETPSQRQTREGKLLFAFRDGLLDRADRGPMHLKDPQAAQIVVDSILFGSEERYSLFKPFREKQVFTYNAREGAKGGSEFLELGYLRPDLILKDLVKIAHPDLLPDYKLYFHKRLE